MRSSKSPRIEREYYASVVLERIQRRRRVHRILLTELSRVISLRSNTKGNSKIKEKDEITVGELRYGGDSIEPLQKRGK